MGVIFKGLNFGGDELGGSVIPTLLLPSRMVGICEDENYDNNDDYDGYIYDIPYQDSCVEDRSLTGMYTGEGNPPPQDWIS